MTAGDYSPIITWVKALNTENQSTMIKDLTSGPIAKTLIVFAFPMLLANLLQTVYNMVDMVVIGRFVGSAALSAVSIGTDIIHLPTFIAMGFCNAGQVIVSQYVGAGDTKSVTRAIGTMFTVLMLGSFVITAICVTGVDTFLNWMNTPPEALVMAKDYSLTCYAGLFFTYGYLLVSAILRGMGDSRHPLIFIAIAAGTNLVLDLVFVIAFKWGTFGAAFATVIGQAISFIISIIFLYKRRQSFGFDFKPKSFKVDKFILIKFLKLGIPMSLQTVAVNFSVLVVNSNINTYGIVASAVTGIGLKLSLVTSVISSSFSTSGAAMIGQCIGAAKTERVPRVMSFSMLVNLAYATALSAITIFLPRQIFGLFNTDPKVLDMAMTFIPCAVLNYYGFAFRSPLFSLINGIGHAKLNLSVALLDGLIGRIVLALFLGITVGMGIRGFWYGSSLAGYIPLALIIPYYLSGKWKTYKLLISR